MQPESYGQTADEYLQLLHLRANWKEALRLSNINAERIQFENKYFRRDISLIYNRCAAGWNKKIPERSGIFLYKNVQFV